MSATSETVNNSLKTRFPPSLVCCGNLFRAENRIDRCATNNALAFERGFPIFHGDLLRIFHLSLFLALNAIVEICQISALSVSAEYWRAFVHMGLGPDISLPSSASSNLHGRSAILEQGSRSNESEVSPCLPPVGENLTASHPKCPPKARPQRLPSPVLPPMSFLS